MNYNVWEKLAHKYNRLWVQKYSLGPTRREVKKIVIPILAENPEIKILEIGCGTGQLIKEISDKFKNVFYLGIDVAKNMVERAKTAVSGENIEFKTVAVEKFDTNERFDLIICTHAFPYFPQKELIIKKMCRFCNKGAKIIIANASDNSLRDKIITFFLKFTTSKASYPSIEEMKKMFGKVPGLKCKDITIIKEKRYMPTIALFYLEM